VTAAGPRCGVCDQPSSTPPLCGKCRAVIGSRRDVTDTAPLPCPSCLGKLAHHVGSCA
jgi:predicted amidophosphoribosyltransferase